MTPANLQTFSDQLQHLVMLENERLARPEKSTIAENNVRMKCTNHLQAPRHEEINTPSLGKHSYM